jgi:FemAB-related protein (PEP-CTERM system-associated)
VFIGNPAAEMIEILLNPDPAAWRGYCGRHHAALFTHLRGWSSALAAAYDLPVFFLLARAAAAPGDTAGILPLLLFSPPGGTRRLISLPYTDAAGIVADSDAVRRRLLAAALELAAATGAAHLELRQYGRFEIVPPLSALTDWQCTAHSFKIGLDRLLPATTAELWDDLPAKVRNQVRKAWRCGCVVRIGGGELVDDVHGVFSDNMRDLGSPTHGVELFRQVIGQDDLRARCIVVYHRGVPAAGAMVFEHGGTLFNPWASSLRRLRPICANMLLYWTMLAHGIRQGCRRFDFGRSSPGTSTSRFKMQWGAGARPLYWYVFSRNGHEWYPSNESLVSEDWKRMDLADSRREGPAIRRWISL